MLCNHVTTVKLHCLSFLKLEIVLLVEINKELVKAAEETIILKCTLTFIF